jgi:hypothetical protein
MQTSNPHIDKLLDLWAAHVFSYAGTPPFANHDDLHNVIDGITEGDAPWHSFAVSYNGLLPESNIPGWMTEKYEVWHRDPRQVAHQLLSNPEFDGHFDYAPYQQFDNGKRRWSDFMSGNWVSKQAVCKVHNFRCINLTKLFFQGSDCGRRTNSWLDVRADHTWERQDNRFSRNRTKRLLPSLYVYWKRQEPHPQSSQECSGLDWLLSNP